MALAVRSARVLAAHRDLRHLLLIGLPGPLASGLASGLASHLASRAQPRLCCAWIAA